MNATGIDQRVEQVLSHRPALPYQSRPKAGRGLLVTRHNRTVFVAGQAYTPAKALELSAAIIRAVNDTHEPVIERAGAHRG